MFPHKVWREIFLKTFQGRLGKFFFRGGGIYLWAAILGRGLMIRSGQEWGSFKNKFFSNYI